MLFPQNDSCRLSPFFIPTCLHIIAKIFGANLVSGFWVKQRAGRRFLRVRRRNGTGGKAVSEGWLALALTGDVTRMKTMIIGGGGVLQCRLR